MLDPRYVVCDRLTQQATRLGRMDIAPLDTSRLNPRDVSLAHAIYDAAIRRWMTLGHLAGLGLSTPFQQCQPVVQAALVCAGAQMLLLDRVPDHAAVSLAVKWATRREGPKVGGFVNAGLRRLVELRGESGRTYHPTWTNRADEIPLADGRALGLTRDVFTNEDDATRLSIATSVSRAYVRRWLKTYEKDEVVRMALHSICSPPTIVNAAHASEPISDDELKQYRLVPHEKPGHFVHRGDREGLIALLEARPDVWVQDPASSASLELAAHLPAPHSPKLIVDVCAGKGTKTRQLAAMFPEAQIIATDIGKEQFSTLADVFSKQQGSHERVRVEPFDALHKQYTGKADLVLLDVPCSNTGVLARRVEARYRGSAEAMDRICSIQREILTSAAGLLASGKDGSESGSPAILYATCSVENRENQEIARDIGIEGLGLRIHQDRQILPMGGHGAADTVWHDGSYACLLRR